MKTAFLATWCSSFAILFLFGAAGLSVWNLTLRAEGHESAQAMVTTLAAVCAVGGAAFGLLGNAFGRIDKLERRVRDLESRHHGHPSET